MVFIISTRLLKPFGIVARVEWPFSDHRWGSGLSDGRSLGFPIPGSEKKASHSLISTILKHQILSKTGMG